MFSAIRAHSLRHICVPIDKIILKMIFTAQSSKKIIVDEGTYVRVEFLAKRVGFHCKKVEKKRGCSADE